MATSTTVRRTIIALIILHLSCCSVGISVRHSPSFTQNPGPPWVRASLVLSDSPAAQQPAASRSSHTGHLVPPVQNQGPTATESDSTTASPVWQQQQQLSGSVASSLLISHPTAAVSRKLLQGSNPALGGVLDHLEPGSQIPDSSSIANGGINTNSTSSNNTSGSSPQTKKTAQDASSTGDIVVLSVRVPSNVKTVQILLTNGVPGSNVTSLSIDGSSSSNVTISLASVPAAQGVAPQNTTGTRSAKSDADSEREFWSWVFVICAACGLCCVAPACVATLESHNRLPPGDLPRAPVIGAPVPGNNAGGVQLGAVQPRGAQCAGLP